MADDGAVGPGAISTGSDASDSHHTNGVKKAPTMGSDDAEWPISPGIATPNPFSRRQTSIDLDDYFVS